MQEILIPVAVLGITGALFAFLLGVISKLTYVPVDERVAAINDVLPGVNCGACGYPGCSGCAGAIAAGEASVSACVVGGADTAAIIAQIMGKVADATNKMVACTKCQGTVDHTKQIYDYTGVSDCRVMNYQHGGCKSCQYGCIGCGTCVEVCQFDAIHMVNGVSVVDPEKCTSCMACINICPKHIIELVPYNAPAQVKCMNPEFGKAVKNVCTIGCIGCGMCAKLAPEDFRMEGKLAHAVPNPSFDIEKIRLAASKCPSKCIVLNDRYAPTPATVVAEAE